MSNATAAVKQKRRGGLLGTIVRRFFLLLFTILLLIFASLVLVMNLIFNGPSPAARNVLTSSLIEASATKWVPALFLGEELVTEIRSSTGVELTEEQTDTSLVVIQKDTFVAADEWADDPDGIRIENVKGSTFDAYVMIVRDPSQVYMGISSEQFSTKIPGKRLNQVIEEDTSLLAAINAGAFIDDGTISTTVGSCPLGLVMSENKCVWETGKQPGESGFAGFNQDNVLVVSSKNPSKAQAEEWGIRDGCCFGPALIINGEVNLDAYNKDSGFNPRTAIGQRSDGAVIFVCADGRQPNSPGATYSDITDIMVEYGAVNACNMDGGSSTVMMYRDTLGKRGTIGDIHMINTYSLLQSEPRRMPNYWLVRSAS